jgi:translation initiation factor 2 alpha subunit (eIF-2alpha)
MSEIRDIIKTELKKGGKIYIQELQRELGEQKHRAYDNLYKSFRAEVVEYGYGSLSLSITSNSSYLWIVNNGAPNGVKVEADVILAWAKQKGLDWIKTKKQAQSIANELANEYYTPGGKLVAGGRRYFFVGIAMEEAERRGVLKDIEKSIEKQVQAVMGWDDPKTVLQLNVG